MNFAKKEDDTKNPAFLPIITLDTGRVIIISPKALIISIILFSFNISFRRCGITVFVAITVIIPQ